MKRYFIPALGVVLLALLIGMAPAAAQEATTIPPTVDAPINVGFDEYDNEGNTYGCNIDRGNWGLGASIRMAPTGRTDSWRPLPGMIEECRGALEFDIQALRTSHPTGVVSATLWLKFWELPHWTGEYSYASVVLKVGGYTGDGTIDGNSVDDGYTEGRRSDFPSDYVPSPVTWIGSPLVFTNSTPTEIYIPVNVTGFVNSSITSQADWAGFTLQIDRASLPDRTILGTDTTMGVTFYSRNSGTSNQPYLEIVLTAEDQVQTIDNVLDYLLTGGDLTAAQVDALDNKLDAALASLGRNNAKAAANQLNAFINNVKSYVKDGYLTTEQGNMLIAAAQAAINAIKP